MRARRQRDVCGHQYLWANCPYCLVEFLREQLARVTAERDRAAYRYEAIRLRQHALVAEREDAQLRAVREKRLRVALEKHIKQAERRGGGR